MPGKKQSRPQGIKKPKGEQVKSMQPSKKKGQKKKKKG